VTSVLNLPGIAQFSAEHLLNGIVEGTALAVLAWVALRVIGGENSRARFGIWFAVLLAIACAPFIDRMYAGVAPTVSGPGINLPESWALYFFSIWAVVASITLIRLGFALWQLRRLRLSAAVVDVAGLDPLLRKPFEEFQASRPVELRTSERVHVPTAIGFLKPTIILPAWVLRELPVEQVHALVLHELAHLRRRDDWTNLIQKLLRAVLFFHPAVWWIDSRLALEREMACDDMVLARTADPRAYAHCLVSVAEKNFLRRGLALAQAAVSRMRHVSMRVKQILGARTQSGGLWKPALSLGVVLSAAFVAFPRVPKLIAFEDSELNLTASTLSPSVDKAVIAMAENGAAAKADVQDVSPAYAVPAAFNPAASRPAAKRALPAGHANFVAAKADHETTVSGREDLIAAKADHAVQTPMPREAVFVVVRSEQDASGVPRSWDVYVIRLTLPQNIQPVEAGVSKQT